MKHSAELEPKKGRPVVFDYGSPAEFLSDLLEYYKAIGPFSLRQRVGRVGTCSQPLVSQILKGKRQLNRDNLTSLALIFKLSQAETQFIDQKLCARKGGSEMIDELITKKVRSPKNHLLADWLNPYVKDLIHLNGFSLEPETLFSMLKGIAPSTRIRKSVEFLIREGFWRVTSTGKLAPDENAVTTTNEIPNDKIRAFHRKALEIAMRGVTLLPPHKRKASTILLSVDKEHLNDLKNLIDSFQHQLLDFIERHPKGRDSLVQIAIHLTPVAGSLDE